MGLRNWFRRFRSKVYDTFGVYDKYNDFTADAILVDGSEVHFQGRPWTSEFNQFKEIVEEHAYAVKVNMKGSFFSFQ